MHAAALKSTNLRQSFLGFQINVGRTKAVKL